MAGTVNGDLLYIDLLNIWSQFFPSHDWNLFRARDRVKKFVEAACNSGYSISFFIDHSNSTEEADEKWKSRRENDIRSGRRGVPIKMSVLLGDMFLLEGIPLHYSNGTDNDDTLAAFAEIDGAIILSGDKDFFRYEGSTFRLMDTVQVTEDGTMILSQKRKKEDVISQSSPRCLLREKPSTLSYPEYTLGDMYIMGSPSPLTRQLNMSTNRILTPLRHTLYAMEGQESLEEMYPEWDERNQRVCWVRQMVCPVKDAECMTLLDAGSPIPALSYFFPKEFDEAGAALPCPASISPQLWVKHCSCLRTSVYQLFLWAKNVGIEPFAQKSLFDYIIEHGGGMEEAFDPDSETPSRFKSYELRCVKCLSSFIFSAKEQEFFESKGFTPPKKCRPCRAAGKASRDSFRGNQSWAPKPTSGFY